MDTLPDNVFHIIEYPGIVKEERAAKAMETLGGKTEIQEAFAKQELGCLQLNYNTKDEFSHAINGDVINTSNLVVCPFLLLLL